MPAAGSPVVINYEWSGFSCSAPAAWLTVTSTVPVSPCCRPVPFILACHPPSLERHPVRTLLDGSGRRGVVPAPLPIEKPPYSPQLTFSAAACKSASEGVV